MRSYSCCNPAQSTTTEFESLAALLKLLGTSSRLRLLCILQDGGEHCVCELSDHVTDMSQSLISHHLSDLKKADIVSSKKIGLRAYYRLTPFGETVVPRVLALKNLGSTTATARPHTKPQICSCKTNPAMAHA